MSLEVDALVYHQLPIFIFVFIDCFFFYIHNISAIYQGDTVVLKLNSSMFIFSLQSLQI